MGSMTGGWEIAVGSLIAIGIAFVAFLHVRRRSPEKDALSTKALLNEDNDKQPMQTVVFKATLNNVNYMKLRGDTELFKATEQTLVAGIARKAGVSESFVKVTLSEGSVKVDAKIQIPPQLEKNAAAIAAELKEPSTGGALLQSLVEKPRFNELKEDPQMDFTVSAISVAETVVEYDLERGPEFDSMNIGASSTATAEEGPQQTREPDKREIGRALQEESDEVEISDVVRPKLPLSTEVIHMAAGPIASDPTEIDGFVDEQGKTVRITTLLDTSPDAQNDVIVESEDPRSGFVSQFFCAPSCKVSECKPCYSDAVVPSVVVSRQ